MQFARGRARFRSALWRRCSRSRPGSTQGACRLQELGISTLPHLKTPRDPAFCSDVRGFGTEGVDTLVHSLELLKERSTRV